MILLKVRRKLTQIIRYSKFTTAGTVLCAQWYGIISEGAHLTDRLGGKEAWRPTQFS